MSGAFGGSVAFGDNASAGDSTLIANGGPAGGPSGGLLELNGNSSGGTARLEVFGNGNLDISWALLTRA